MEYREINPTSIQEGVWNEKTCVRRTAGFDIDKTNLPADMKYLPKGAVLALDSDGLKVVLVKTAKATASAISGATSLKVAKGHALVVGVNPAVHSEGCLCGFLCHGLVLLRFRVPCFSLVY